MDKYGGRFYAVPAYEAGHKKRFAGFHGQFLVVDMPKISENSFYAGFFAKCQILFESTSGKITSRVYSCQNNS